MCMTRMDTFEPGATVTVTPIRTFPIIRDLVTDVSYSYVKAKQIPPLRLKPPDADGKYRMMQEDVDRPQEFHKCIECFLCQDVCHVIRDHDDKKSAFSGPRFFIKAAGLDMHPLDTLDRSEWVNSQAGIGLCNITKCCTEVCPEHIHITDNGIIPMKERMADNFDPVVWLLRKFRGGRKEPA
jgi:succinate dehydrogenase / fumarate reductase iron-sulfur subunit